MTSETPSYGKRWCEVGIVGQLDDRQLSQSIFFMYDPRGPTAFCNAPTCVQLRGAWVVKTIAYLCGHHIARFTPTTHAALTFKNHVDELCDATLLPWKTVRIWGSTFLERGVMRTTTSGESHRISRRLC